MKNKKDAHIIIKMSASELIDAIWRLTCLILLAVYAIVNG